jgi:APA family basic amino acid/polyamine antiporter
LTAANDGKMGIWMTSALVVGTIIGAGIFMLPVSLAPLGMNALLGWLVSGAGVLCIAFAFAQVSRLGGDGIQANVEREFGPTVAFLVAWAFWVSNWTAQASVAIAVGSTLSFIAPAILGASSVVPIGIACIVILTLINAIGVRAAGGFSIITVAIKILPLLAVVWIFAERGASGTRYEPLPPLPVDFGNLATATALTFFALTGFEAATAPVNKVKNATRTIPRALIGGTIFVVVLYMLAGTSIQMLVPAETVASSSAPFADAIISRWGNGAATLAALAIAVSAIGCLNGLILGTGELGYSMALRGDLPSVMARTHGSGTPVVSQLVAAVITILLLLANSSRATANLYTFIILLSTAAIVVLYFVGSLAAWRANASLGARWIILLALGFVLFAAYGTGLEACLWVIALLGTGLVIRAVMHRLNSRAGSIRVEEASPAVLPGSSA